MSDSSATVDRPGLDKRGKFAKGNTLGANRKGPKKGTVEGFRQDLLDDWANSNPKTVLKKVREEKPVEYVKAVTALSPKQSDAIITRNVVFSLFPKGPPADWKPMTDEDLDGDSEVNAT